MKLCLFVSFAVIALAGCANGPGRQAPVQSPHEDTPIETAHRQHQMEEQVNVAQADAERYKSEVVMCQKTVEETHHLYEEAVAKAQQYYRETAPVIKQGASDAVKAGTVWVQKKLDEQGK